MVAYAAGFAALSALRHLSFATGRFDLGNMVQAVWATAHGRFLEATLGTGEQASRFASHVDPILAIFAPATLVAPTPEVLIVAQAIVLAAGAESESEMAHRGAEAAAARLGTTPVTFPSDHGGFLGGEYGQTGKPDEFAARLREVLATR